MAEEGQHATAAGGWVACVFTEDEEKRALCADFLMSIYGNDEGMSGWCQAGGYLPTRKSVYEKDEYFSHRFRYAILQRVSQQCFGSPLSGKVYGNFRGSANHAEQRPVRCYDTRAGSDECL